MLRAAGDRSLPRVEAEGRAPSSLFGWPERWAGEIGTPGWSRWFPSSSPSLRGSGAGGRIAAAGQPAAVN